MPNVLAIIPARYASTRFPAKLLAPISGIPMIRRVYERVCMAASVGAVLVATDDERIRDYVVGFGGNAVMTSAEHHSGSDRIAEAAQAYSDAEIIVNVQGDEPLIAPDMIDALVSSLHRNDTEPVRYDCATPVVSILSARELHDPNVVKAVMESDGTAMYFSRHAVPYLRDHHVESWLNQHTFYKHIGVYAYRRASLYRFVSSPPSVPERAEQLEQLRMLGLGMKILCVVTDYDSCAVDVPEDVAKVEERLRIMQE